jgi:acetophenone carboxylase
MPRDFEVTKHYKPEPITEQEIEDIKNLPPADYEIYSRKLEMVCLEAKDTIKKMGVSAALQAGDVCAGIYTPKGDLGVAILGTHLHLVNGQIGIKYIVRHFLNDPSVGVREGDMFYVNDAEYGGMHNPDQILITPVYYKGELVAWAATMGHEPDTGAIQPGGVPPSATSRYDEGLHLSPIKIGENSILRTDLLDLMENHCRDPRTQTLDVKARVAANMIIEKRVKDLLNKKGVSFFRGIMRRMIEESSSAARKKVSELRDGLYRQPVFFSNWGSGKNALLRSMVSVIKKGDTITIDFSGTSPRVTGGNFNSFPHCMIAMTACYLFQFIFNSLKPSCGIFSPMQYIFPKGCFLDADHEDAVSMGVPTVASCVNAVHTCFSKMLFASGQKESVQACWGTVGTPVFGGLNQYGQPFATYDLAVLNGACQGAKYNHDGTDAGGFAYCAYGDFGEAEIMEMQYPVIPLIRNKYFPDGHGFGKYRGGRPAAIFYVIKDNKSPIAQPTIGGASLFPVSPGLFGGYSPPPAPSVRIKKLKDFNLKEALDQLLNDPPSFFEKDGDAYKIYSDNYFSSGMFLEEGDMAFYVGFGGPGYGDPLERDPKLVERDLKEHSISTWAATNVYKVQFDSVTLDVDPEATNKLRQKARKERLKRGKSYKEFLKIWSKKKPPESILKHFGPWPFPGKKPELIEM